MIVCKFVLLFSVMLAFRAEFKRFPSTKTLEEDKAALSKLRDNVMEELKVKKDLVPEDFVE